MGKTKTHCLRGHELAGENLYVYPNGKRRCRVCHDRHAAAKYRKDHKDSLRARQKVARVANPTARKNSDRRYKYGVEPDVYAQKLHTQNNRCAICKKLLTTPHLDHNHETQQVRDLLCKQCNLALGFLQDDVEIARAVVA